MPLLRMDELVHRVSKNKKKQLLTNCELCFVFHPFEPSQFQTEQMAKSEIRFGFKLRGNH